MNEPYTPKMTNERLTHVVYTRTVKLAPHQLRAILVQWGREVYGVEFKQVCQLDSHKLPEVMLRLRIETREDEDLAGKETAP